MTAFVYGQMEDGHIKWYAERVETQQVKIGDVFSFIGDEAVNVLEHNGTSVEIREIVIDGINPNLIYKINPEFDEWETDTYKLASRGEDGLYFHRFVDGHPSLFNIWFSNYELDKGVLVVA